MVKYFSEIIGQKIISLETNEQIGFLKDCLFDYENGKILSFLVKKTDFLRIVDMLLLPQDLTKWGQNIYIKDDDGLSLPEDIIRLRDYKKTYFPLIGLPAYTENNKKIGFVLDYAISDLEYKLKKICIGEKGFFIFKNHQINCEISREKIVKITRKKIIIKDYLAREIEQERETNYIPEPSF